MAVIYIDHKPYEVDQQKNLLETAVSLGLDLPYFCWHPSLGSVGSCRLCAVQQFADENDQNGRMVMACMTPAKDNSRFSIAHPTCSGFRESVIEWLMLNHPHDCPVCDEGGECHLQDMTLMSGHNYRRSRFPKRTFRNQNLGAFINHEMNRCITCYRCVRYYKDVAGGDDLSAFASSGRVYFGRNDDGVLNNYFSGNLVEVCPTGVFTDKTYHQRYVRKWDLSTAPSVCQLCSLGCNIAPGERGGILRRVQNRYHRDINGYFICDRGRFGHEFVNHAERLLTPHGASSINEGYEELKRLVKNARGVVGIGSPRASLEANFMLKRLVEGVNFYDGLTESESRCSNQLFALLSSRATMPASLKDIREADAVVIIGEDVMHTAPLIALAIRQSNITSKQNFAQALQIPEWNDAAIRDFSRNDLLPIFVAHTYRTELDALSANKIISHPFALRDVAHALARTLKGEQLSDDLSADQKTFVEQAAAALRHAKRPVIIAGSSLGDADLLHAVVDAACNLDQLNGGSTRISLISSDVNSVGLSMLKPKPTSELLTDQSPIDVAIVLENDLQWRMGKSFQQLCKRVKHLVVVDSMNTLTAKKAHLSLPCSSFLESTGSVVSSEGRIQRYFSVAKNPSPELETSWRIFASCMGERGQHLKTNDDVFADLARELGLNETINEKLFDANFTINGKKVPRQTTEFSGRTAFNAAVTMHEPKPVSDVDSPLAFSMEGQPFKKIPLPLISSSWEPKYNSMQSSFRRVLPSLNEDNETWGGVRLFDREINAKNMSHTFSKRTKIDDGKLYVIPQANIFGSLEFANYSPALLTRMPLVQAQIGEQFAKEFGFLAGATIVLETNFGNFSLLAKTLDDLPPGILLLPYGLVDAALFFNTWSFRVVVEEKV